MIENCAIYLPVEKIKLDDILPNVKSNGRIFKKATFFEYMVDDCNIKLHIMPKSEINNHLSGFQNYVLQLDNNDSDKNQAQEKIKEVKNVLGVTLSKPIEVESNAFSSLIYLIENLNGFMFIENSLLLPDGRFIVGPLSYEQEDIGEPVEINPEDYRYQRDTTGIPEELVKMREKNYCKLAEHGFKAARSLPINTDSKLRPMIEIASRLYALNALVMWVTIPEDFMPTDDLKKLIEKQNIHQWLTEQESEILKLSREEAKEEHIDSIGWRFENMWPLAWILGFKTPPLFYIGQVPEEISTEMLLQFIPENQGPEQILAKNNIRTETEIVEMEDLFYCAHNAVRSAQMGIKSVPPRFHPIIDGGAIHERRHSLTWSLSPDTSWEETDLST